MRGSAGECYLYGLHHEDRLRYVGVSTNPWRRLGEHASRKWPIGYAIRKYGAEAFDLRIISKHTTRAEAHQAEIAFIALHKPDLNITPGGEGIILEGEARERWLAACRSPASRAKISALRRAENARRSPEEIKARGKRLANSSLDKRAAAMRAHWAKPEYRERVTAKAMAWTRDPEKWAAAVKKRTENVKWRASQILIHHKRLENPNYRKNVMIAQRARRAREKEEKRLRLQDHHPMCISASCALASTSEESS